LFSEAALIRSQYWKYSMMTGSFMSILHAKWTSTWPAFLKRTANHATRIKRMPLLWRKSVHHRSEKVDKEQESC
jgi:hypothetical protein